MRIQQTKTMTAAEAIVESIKQEGIDHVFCVPGESYLPVLDALYDEPAIRVLSNRHEGGAAFMAEGFAKSKLKPGVVLATRGVGATNLSIGVHTAYQDSTPMVVLLGQVHSQFRGREGFQEVDLDQYFQSIAKWAVELKDPERTQEIMERAFRIAQSGRPGPVVISLPEDVLPKETEVYERLTSTTVPKPQPSLSEIKEIEKILASANYPLVIAGGGVKSSQAEEELVKFAEAYNLPVMAAFRRHDVFPNDHALYVGHLGLGTHPEELQTVKDADVILALGTRLSEVTTQDYSIITPDKKLIHIDIDYMTLGKVYAPEVGVVADLQEALQACLRMNVQPKWQAWAKERNTAYRKASSLEVGSDDVINKKIIAQLDENLPSSALLTVDAGNFAGWLHSYYPFTEKHTFVGPTSGAMGYGMPAALGAKLAHPDKTVVSLSGDGGFMMTMQELETAVRNEIPIISLVFNNYMYGTIRMHQEMHYPEKVMATDLGEVFFSDLAQSVGAYGHRVTTAEEFAAVFKESLTRKDVPTVIEIVTGKEHISVSATISSIREQANQSKN